ncbi:MAG: hypothetical protein HN692_05865 [Candidatus Cloacimonetes bacterium]|nr:hypothetical protein [Candidatus Cloacimonadota bacterium]
MFICTILFAENTKFSDAIEMYLQTDISYQQKINSIQIDQAQNTIEKSQNWFDVNFDYRNKFDANVSKLEKDFNNYNNEIIEYDSSSTLNNNEKEFKLEMSKTFFRKDFDNVVDKVNFQLDELNSELEIEFYQMERIAEIIDDLILWNEANARMEILQNKLDILQREKNILEGYFADNLLKTRELIDNLEEIVDLKNELKKWNFIQTEKKQIYGEFNLFNSFQLFFTHRAKQIKVNDFQKIITKKQNDYANSVAKIKKSLSISKFTQYLPEINLELSYNKKFAERDWEVTKIETNEDNQIWKIFNRITRNDETYPEARIEFSLPFNFVGNNVGKQRLQNELHRKIELSKSEIVDKLEKYKMKQLFNYNFEFDNYLMMKEIFLLQQKQQKIVLEKYKLEPSLLGLNPEIVLAKAENKFNETKLLLRKAKMKESKEKFLINYYLEN